MADLKGRSIRGGAVTFAAQGIKFALTMGSTMVLARLLTPADFGLVAMVTAFTGFAALFKDAGLSMATVQREHITHLQVSTLFWINVALSVLVMFVVAAFAPAIAWFYDEPRLVWITLASAATFVLGGLTVQHQALLTRQMKFRELAIVDVLSMVVGFATATIMAVLHSGYWSLIGLTAGSALAYCMLVWKLSGWKPGLPRRRTGVRPMLRFGGELTMASSLNYIGGNIDKVLVGALLGPVNLGLYDRCYRLMLMPLNQLAPPLAAVAQPALARVASTPLVYRAAYLGIIEKMAYIVWPFVSVGIVAPDWALRVGLGSGWETAVTPFRVLLFATFLLPIWNSTGWLFVSQGRTTEHLLFHIYDSILKIVSVIIGLYWGLLGVCVAVAVRYFAVAPLLVKMVGAKGPVVAADFAHVLWRPALNACVVACVIIYLRNNISLGPLLGLSFLIIMASAVTFTFMLTNQSGRRVLKDIADLQKHFGQRRDRAHA